MIGVCSRDMLAVEEAPASPVFVSRFRSVIGTDKDGVMFTEIDDRGGLWLARQIDAVTTVRIKPIGSIKTRARQALYEAALLTDKDIGTINMAELTYLERAALNLALGAKAGNIMQVTELFDRIIGRPTQHVEALNLNKTIDDVLSEIPDGDIPMVESITDTGQAGEVSSDDSQ